MTTQRRARNEVAPPRLPRPLAELDLRYINQLVAALEEAIDVLGSKQAARFAEISLSDTPENGAGLRVGAVFSDGGVLKIVRTGDTFAGTFKATTAVGSVTVTTS